MSKLEQLNKIADEFLLAQVKEEIQKSSQELESLKAKEAELTAKIGGTQNAEEKVSLSEAVLNLLSSTKGGMTFGQIKDALESKGLTFSPASLQVTISRAVNKTQDISTKGERGSFKYIKA